MFVPVTDIPVERFDVFDWVTTADPDVVPQEVLLTEAVALVLVKVMVCAPLAFPRFVNTLFIAVLDIAVPANDTERVAPVASNLANDLTFARNVVNDVPALKSSDGMW
jgi:hypothetical protein